MLQVGFIHGSNLVPVLRLTPDLEALVERSGFDPRSFNHMIWPIGASQHARGLFLMHQADLATVLDGQPEGFRIGGVTFNAIKVKNPKPIGISEGSGAIYAVEVVDERENWQQDSAQPQGSELHLSAFNLHLDDKGKIYQHSAMPNAFEILLNLLKQLNANVNQWFIPSGAIEFSLDEVRDVVIAGLSLPVMIDKLLSFAGYVLLAFPNTNHPGAAGFRYRVVSIASGEQDALDNLTEFSHSLVGGGIYSPTSLVTKEPTGPAKHAFGAFEWMSADVPSAVAVAFPVAPKGGIGHDFNVEEATPGMAGQSPWVLDRYHSVITDAGRPPKIPGNGRTYCVFDQRWAVRDEETGQIENAEFFDLRANLLAARYYRRFYSGVGDFLLLGIQPVAPYAGAHEILWSFNEAGAVTRVRGRVDHPLYGYGYRGALTASDIFSTGGTRAVPRSDGGVLIDSPAPTSAPFLFPALITAVYGQEGEDIRYDAEVIGDSSIFVEMAAPFDRDIAGTIVDYAPLAVGAPCIIAKYPGDKVDPNPFLAFAWEVQLTAQCDQDELALQMRNDRLRDLTGAL